MSSIQVIKIYITILLFFIATGCLAQDVKPAIGGSRIGWDFSTLTRVSSGRGGYARMIQLQDKSLICVYETDGNIVAVKSYNEGKTWSAETIIAPKADRVNMSVPDILQLKDLSILVCYNPRPQRGSDTSEHFAIKTKKSYDNGQTWTDERTLYQADHLFENGCWEPSAIQLPGGQIQLFFANEGPYRKSNEQEISMTRSNDNGLSWTTAQSVSFRPHSRDGMPVPVLLQNGREIAYAIEDNGFKNFKPYIIRSTLKNDWAKTVGANDENRNYALADEIPDSIYAGAPYLRQLKTGETILSYQGTEGRINNMNHSEMKVVIGDDHATNFNRKTVPFKLAAGKSGLWNSLSVLNEYTVVALTSTNNYSAGHGSEVWMIEGHIIPELKAIKRTITMDGGMHDNEFDAWDKADIFIGHDGPRSISAGLAYDDHYLYFFSKVFDKADSVSTVTVYLDPQNKHYAVPSRGNYKISLTAKNKLQAYTGSNGNWMPGKLTGVKTVIRKINGYFAEMAIPWTSIGGKPALNKRIGLNVALTASDGYTENISSNEVDKPFTWCTLKLY
jgi:hypothetical protein